MKVHFTTIKTNLSLEKKTLALKTSNNLLLIIKINSYLTVYNLKWKILNYKKII